MWARFSSKTVHGACKVRTWCRCPPPPPPCMRYQSGQGHTQGTQRDPKALRDANMAHSGPVCSSARILGGVLRVGQYLVKNGCWYGSGTDSMVHPSCIELPALNMNVPLPTPGSGPG